MAKESVFTTGKVAKLCGVTINTVVKWFDSGALQGYRIPSSGDRRIPRKNLVEFMKSHSFPLGELEETTTRVLIVDDDPVVVEVISRMLKNDGEYKVEIARSGFRAGVLAKGFQPDVLVLDIMLGDINGREVCQIIRSDPSLKDIKILAISGKFDTKEEAMEYMEGQINDFLPKPFETAALMKRLKRLAE